MMPKRYAPILFGLILSGLMSLLISGIATLKVIGLEVGLVNAWASAWALAWSVAFPIVLFVGPLTRRMVDSMTTGRS